MVLKFLINIKPFSIVTKSIVAAQFIQLFQYKISNVGLYNKILIVLLYTLELK